MVPEKYDFVIIGGGSAGLTAASFANQIGKKVLLIEKNRIGGDCTWTGCVPSKTLIKVANLVHEMRTADRFGLQKIEPQVDLKKIMKHVQSVIQEVYSEEKPEVLEEEGISVIIGDPKFVDAKTLEIGNQEILFDKLLICTGAKPSLPSIEGLEKVNFHTYESIFSLKKLPERLLVIGGGPIASELSQAFNRLGSNVTMFVRSRLLSKEEPEVSELLDRVFKEEGITIHYKPNIKKVVSIKQEITINFNDKKIQGGDLLIATGRKPNIESLNLQNANIDNNEDGIVVDKKLRTSTKNIFAAGDCVAGNAQFTHYAGWQGWIATRNALLPGTSEGQNNFVPWATFTNPEIAHIGLLEEEAKVIHPKSMSYILPASKYDRAKTDRELEGFIKLVLNNDGTCLGATIVSPRAGEAIQEWVMAVEHGNNISDIAGHIHVYPTYLTGSQDLAASISLKNFFSSTKGKIAKLFI